MSKVNNVAAIGNDVRDSACILNPLIWDTAVDFNATVKDNVEDRRRRWTKFVNLKLWFDVWENALLELWVAYKVVGRLIIPKEKICTITNLDESCLLFDVNEGRWGGRPDVTYSDPRLPILGKCASKSNVTATFIGGISASGESPPPHLQFITTTKENNVKTIWSNFPVHGKIPGQVWVGRREVSYSNSWFEQERGHGWCIIWNVHNTVSTKFFWVLQNYQAREFW